MSRIDPRCWPYGGPLWTPALLPLSSWQSGPYASPWPGQVSLGLSGGRSEFTNGSNPLPSIPGPTLNGIQSKEYFGGVNQDNFGSVKTNDLITATAYSFSMLAKVITTFAPAVNAYENGCFVSQQNGNPAWGIGFNTSGVLLWHYEPGGTYPKAGPYACSVGAVHLIDGYYSGGNASIRIDRGAWNTVALAALDATALIDTVHTGGNSYNNAVPMHFYSWERWTSKSVVAPADFDFNAGYINRKFGTSF